MPVARRPLVATAALALCAVAAPAALAGGSGAVFTTDAQGLKVNQNAFASPLDVHLNGGPPCNAAAQSAGLADGWYVFRVTDPSGKIDMSGAEPLAERRFRVKARAVVETADPVDHPIGATACGAVLRVGPFAENSPNGVYKLWVSPASARPGRRGSGAFGPCQSKTDNFTIDHSLAPPPGGGGGGGTYALGMDGDRAATPAPESPTGREHARQGRHR